MRFVDDHAPWQLLTEGAPREHRLLTLDQWRELRLRWPAQLATGVELPNDTDIAAVAADLPRWQLVLLQFPKWTDGRAYSQARLLRARHGYRGDLRAAGDVVADMAPLLQRAGFSSVRLRDGELEATARRALGFFGAHYQADAVQNHPPFARRAA